jgi:hypothetical protein
MTPWKVKPSGTLFVFFAASVRSRSEPTTRTVGAWYSLLAIRDLPLGVGRTQSGYGPVLGSVRTLQKSEAFFA